MTAECLHAGELRVRLSLSEWCVGCGAIRDQGFDGDEAAPWRRPNTPTEAAFADAAIRLRFLRKDGICAWCTSASHLTIECPALPSPGEVGVRPLVPVDEGYVCDHIGDWRATSHTLQCLRCDTCWARVALEDAERAAKLDRLAWADSARARLTEAIEQLDWEGDDAVEEPKLERGAVLRAIEEADLG